MTEQLEKWIESWWEDHERPAAVQEKQIWTIFLPGDSETREGTVIAVLSMTANACLAVPLHQELQARTDIEPVLADPDLPFAAPMVAAVPAVVTLSLDAFNGARYLGEMREAAHQRLLAAHREFLGLAQSLSELQALEAEHGPQGVPQADLQRIFSAGVLKLVPAADPDELAAFHDQLLANLRPYQLMENAAAPALSHDLGLDLNLDQEHYKSIIEFLDRELSSLAREEINNHSAAGDKERAQDLNLLAALVYARTGQWNRVELSLRGLLGSEQSGLAERGMTWLQQNLNREAPGGPSPAAGVAAPDLAFYEFIRVSDPGQEIGKILRKLGSPVALARKK
jgi:hypothetical protein